MTSQSDNNQDIAGSELRKKILNDILVHDTDCSLSMYGTDCDCIQSNVADAICHVVAAHDTEKKQQILGARRSLCSMDGHAPALCRNEG